MKRYTNKKKREKNWQDILRTKKGKKLKRYTKNKKKRMKKRKKNETIY